MMRPNKLECLELAITFQSSLTFVGNTRSLPKKEAERCSHWVCSGLDPEILRPDFKRVSKDKHSSLLGLFVCDKEKSLITSTPGVNVIKLFSFVADDETK
jgi:hypothetical protein